MREILFRAWDKELKCYSYIAAGNLLRDMHQRGLDEKDRDRYVLEQYRGFKDKNGVRVFEGDTYAPVSAFPTSGRALVCYWDELLGRFMWRDTNSGARYGSAWVDFSKRIGNIHEDKEQP